MILEEALLQPKEYSQRGSSRTAATERPLLQQSQKFNQNGGKKLLGRSGNNYLNKTLDDLHNILKFKSKESKDDKFQCCGIYITIALLMLSFTGAMIMFTTNWFDTTLQKIITLSNGTYIYNIWRDSEYELIIHVYPFNYTNVEAILAGTEKPVLKQIGPYVFRQKISKWNVSFQDMEKVTYSENATDTSFLSELSNGTLEDIIHTPNMVLISIVNIVKELDFFTQLSVSASMKSLRLQPFFKIPIRELILGYDEKVAVLLDIVTLIDQEIPPSTGLLSNRIGLLPDEITIGTGIPDLGQRGIIQQYNGKDRMDIWNGDECNNITASDGMLLPAEFVRSEETLYFFRRILCRRFPFLFEKHTTTAQSYPVRRYTFPEHVFSYGSNYSHNECYCLGTCPPSGIYYLSPCFYGTPLFLSKPHFLHADRALLEDLEGLHPDPKEHTSYLDVHDAGLTIAAELKLQVGIVVNKARYMSVLKELKDGIALPVGWITLSSTNLTGISNLLVYHLTYTIPIVELFLQCSFSILFLLFLIRLILYFCNI